MEKIIMTCDCPGCDKTTDTLNNSWITIKQTRSPEVGKAKIERDIHVCSFECFEIWSNEACREAFELEECIKDAPQPRGKFSSEEMPYISI